MKRWLIFLVMCAYGMEPQPESIHSLLAKIVRAQEEQKKETEALKQFLEANLQAIKDKLLDDSDSNKRKKTDNSAPEETSQLRKDMQMLTQEYNIHNKTLQILEKSCAQVVQKKSVDHAGLLKRLEEEIKQLKTSHGVLSDDLEISKRAIRTCQGLLEEQSGFLATLGQQMQHHIACLGSIITIMQSVEGASAGIRERLEQLPVVVFHQAQPPPPSPEPLPVPIPPFSDGTINPALLMKDPGHFN